MDYKRKEYNKISIMGEQLGKKNENVTNTLLQESFYFYEEFKNDTIELHSICIYNILLK